jgi:anti-sigma-K factor RskA
MAVIRGPGTRAVQIPVSTNGQVGAITIFDDTTTHRWVVTCHNLAANQPGQAYQLWFLTDQGPRSAALMLMDSSRPMMLTLEMPKGSVRVMGAAMSIEPAAGSNWPTGPIVFRFTL